MREIESDVNEVPRRRWEDALARAVYRRRRRVNVEMVAGIAVGVGSDWR